MRLKVNNVRVSLLEETSVKEAAAKKLGLKKQDIDNLQIVRRAVDARRKNNISLNYHVLIDLEISSKQLGRLLRIKMSLYWQKKVLLNLIWVWKK